MLEDRLKAVERQLAITLDSARASFKHSGLRGDRAEAAVRDFLSRHLPQSSSVGTGEVIDSLGGVSRQTDVIITNEWHPFRYDTHEPGIYLIEGIAAAGEIKSCLTLKELNDSLEKGSTFKHLQNARGTIDDDNAEDSVDVTTPPYFLFAYETSVAAHKLVDTLFAATTYREDGYKVSSPIDAVFILGAGACIDYGDGNQGFRRRFSFTRYLEMDMRDWYWHPSNYILTWLLSWLHETVDFHPRVRPSVISRYLQPNGVSILDSIHVTRVRRDSHIDLGDPRTWPNSPWSRNKS